MASIYNQVVLTAPQAVAKKLIKAIKKKFGIHVIAGGEIHSVDGVGVTILANDVNSVLLTIVQVYAEGYVEGAT